MYKWVIRIASARMLSVVFTIEFLAEMLWVLISLMLGGVHTINIVGVITQDYKPLRYNFNEAHKH
jgi:hypothetical protein